MMSVMSAGPAPPPHVASCVAREHLSAMETAAASPRVRVRGEIMGLIMIFE
eukprot:COSAG01_NODE_3028_length_6703_cov_2.824955_5_plen_51_part_00